MFSFRFYQPEKTEHRQMTMVALRSLNNTTEQNDKFTVNLLKPHKVWGDGSDGAFYFKRNNNSWSWWRRVYILNYSSISITGTGKLVSQTHTQTERWSSSRSGDCELTSSLLLGLTVRVSVARCRGQNAGSSTVYGSSGNDGQSYGYVKQSKATGQRHIQSGVRFFCNFGGWQALNMMFGSKISNVFCW